MAKAVTYDQVPLCPSISLARALRTLQQHETLCDLTLIADDHKRVHVHRAVFAAMSGYIQKRLKNKQPCDSFILTGITVDGIRSLTEFVYGNVYAIHCNNVEEVYPLAMLFELHLLCKVAEYIDPEVKNMEWSNKIIPVSPNLLSRKPTKPLQVRKQVEENNNGTPGKIEDQNTEDDAGQSAKRKRTATNPTPKVQQAKRVRKEDGDENSKTEKSEQDSKKLKGDNNKANKDENTDTLKKYKRESSDAVGKPVITQELKIRLERIDHEIKREPSKKKSIPSVPEVSSPVKGEDKPEAQEPDVICTGEDNNDKKDTSSIKEKKTATQQEERTQSQKKKETSTNEEEITTTTQKERSPSKEKRETSTNEEEITTQQEERSPSKEKKETSTKEEMTAAQHRERSPSKKKKETSTHEKETSATSHDENSPKKEKKETGTSKHAARKPKEADQTVFECGRCKVIFTSLEKCNEHMAKVHNVSMVAVNQNYICSKENCGFKCSDAITLKDHVLVKHPQALVKKHKCGICDSEFGGVEALETHVSTMHSKRGNNEKEKHLPVVNGKDNKDEPVLDRTTGELKVTNRPGPESVSVPNRTTYESKATNRPGPKSAKLKQTKLIPDSSESDSSPKRTETKMVNGQKIKVTYIDDRVIRVEDDSLLEGWAKLLVARKDLSKYDLYIQSPDNKRHRSLTDLHKYLDSKQIEMETDHISFSQAQLLEETGIPPPPGAKGTPRRRSQKPGPKSSKKFKEHETSDEEMEVDETSFDESEKKVNGNISHDEDEMNHEEACDEDNKKICDESKEQEQCEKNSNNHVLQVDVHAY